jgi:hypothetical protein
MAGAASVRDPPPADLAATSYRDRFREAFAAALSQAAAKGEVDGRRTRARADLLTAMTMGLFLMARMDLAGAAAVSESVAAEVSSWSVQPGLEVGRHRRRSRPRRGTSTE